MRPLRYITFFALGFIGMELVRECVRSNNAEAKELVLLDVTYMAMEVNKIEKTYDPYMPTIGDANDSNATEYWTYGAAAKMNYDLLRYKSYGLYWRNNIHMDATNKQVRHVGWEWDFGIALSKKLELYHYHHSRHVLDATADTRYPLIDRYGVRFIFINK